MPVPLVAAAGAVEGIAKTIGSLGGLFNTGSPRYQEGPLVSTVQEFLRQAEAGNLAEIRRINAVRLNPQEPHRRQWQSVWDDLLVQVNLPPAARQLIAQLDSSKAYLVTPERVMPVERGGVPAAADDPTGTKNGATAPAGANAFAGLPSWAWLVIIGLLVFLFLRK